MKIYETIIVVLMVVLIFMLGVATREVPKELPYEETVLSSHEARVEIHKCLERGHAFVDHTVVGDLTMYTVTCKENTNDTP